MYRERVMVASRPPLPDYVNRWEGPGGLEATVNVREEGPGGLEATIRLSPCTLGGTHIPYYLSVH